MSAKGENIRITAAVVNSRQRSSAFAAYHLVLSPKLLLDLLLDPNILRGAITSLFFGSPVTKGLSAKENELVSKRYKTLSANYAYRVGLIIVGR